MGKYVTFIVRLARTGKDDVDGVVERVRTGEKARFRGLDAIGLTIRRMLGSDVPDPGVGAGGDPPQSTRAAEAPPEGERASQ